MRFGVRWAVGVLAAVAAAVGAAPAGRADMPVKLVMDWAFEGAQSIWTLSQERGCFAKAGLDVTIDRGFGSGDSASKVAAGAYDVGGSDLNTGIHFSGENPEKIIALFVIHHPPPSGLIPDTTARRTKPRDLI